MKVALLWLLAIVGGAAVGAVGGTAWLVYRGVPVPEEVAESAQGAEDPASEGRTAVASGSSESARPGESESTRDVGDLSLPGVVPVPAEAASGAAGTDAATQEPGTGAATQEADSGSGTSMPGTMAQGGAPQGGPANPPSEPNPNHERLARIFAAMKPGEAASVLGQLGDTEIQGILMAMPARNAAPILAELDPARAASLSRLVLGGRSP